MGKGGGCGPSKKNFLVALEGAPNSRREASIEGRSLSALATAEEVVTSSEDASFAVVNARKLKIFIVFYSMYGHVEKLAIRMKKGVDGIEGVEGMLFRVPKTLPPDVLEQMKAPAKDNDIPTISAAELPAADGMLFGFPTRYGCMAAQLKAFFDSMGQLWQEHKSAGKPAGFFVSTGTQGGGQETTAWTAITQLCHHGMLFVPIGYTFGAGMFKMDDIRGGVFAGDGTRELS